MEFMNTWIEDFDSQCDISYRCSIEWASSISSFLSGRVILCLDATQQKHNYEFQTNGVSWNSNNLNFQNQRAKHKDSRST